jgi:phosphatidylserine synthase
LFFIGLPFISSKPEVMYFLIIILFISILMISNLKFYSLKNINSNEKKVFLLLLMVTNLTAIVSAFVFDISAFSIPTMIILSYLISSSLSLLSNRLNSSS